MLVAFLASHDVSPARTLRHAAAAAYSDLALYARVGPDGRVTITPTDQLPPGAGR